MSMRIKGSVPQMAERDRRALPGVLAGEPDPERRRVMEDAYRQTEVPVELRGRLNPQDPMQRAALRDYNRNLSAEVTRLLELLADGDDIAPDDASYEFEVEIEATATKSVLVRAADEEEARELAESGEYEDDGSWDFETEHVEVISRRKRCRTEA
jgi:hypothetical protein